MKLTFNPIRLIIVSLSTFLIVVSVTWYAQSMSNTARSNQGRMKPESTSKAAHPGATESNESAESHQMQQPLTIPQIKESTTPSTVAEGETSSANSEDGENPPLPKNAIPWNLKPVEQLENPQWLRRPDDWQVFNLEESGDLLRKHLEQPEKYYGKFDLQEDLSQWRSPPGNEPDWTTMPWEELRKRYISRNPDRAKPTVGQGEQLAQNLSTEEQQILGRTRYRLVELE